MAGASDGSRLEVLDRPTCLGLLATVEVGRLVFTRRTLPEVFPVNFRLYEDGVVIRVADTSPAVAGALDTVVAFQADDIDARARRGWSVTVVGHSSEILDQGRRERVFALPL
jgi:hypothetical protein